MPTVRQSQKLASTPIPDAPSAQLTETIKTATTLTPVQRVQRREQQRHFDDKVSQAFLANFHCLQECLLEMLQTVE